MKAFFAFVLALVLWMSAAPAAYAQTPVPPEENTLLKIKQLELLGQILPLLMTRDQLGKVLSAIERARARSRDMERSEAAQLRAMNAELDEALKAAYDEGHVPKADLLNRVQQMLWTFTVRRAALGAENEDAVLAVLRAELNAGQIKAAANALRPQAFAPGVRPEDLTDDDKLRIFVRVILLDADAYDVLVRLNRPR